VRRGRRVWRRQRGSNLEAYQVYVSRAQIVFAVYGLNAYCSEMNDGCDAVFSVSGLKAKSSTSYFSNQ
jgi:hypothetical protein